MIRILAVLILCATSLAAARAEPPRVMTDIAPVHSLVSIVMRGVGEPEVLLPPGASPHNFALRPSDARRLSKATAMIWIGADLTPWLERSIAALAPDASSLQLIETPGTFTLAYREDTVFTAHEDPSTGQQAHEAHAHGEQAHGEHAHGNDHDDHGAKKVGIALRDDHAGHDHHGSFDLHAWQDPENAKTWLDAIAVRLGELDPDNALTYGANALAAKQDIDALIRELDAALGPVSGRPFIVMHDAYHYFENRFGITATAAVLPGDGQPASAGRVRAISRMMAGLGQTCIFIEPQMSEALIRTLADEHGARIARLDPLGDSLNRGPELYPGLLRSIGQSLVDCLS